MKMDEKRAAFNQQMNEWISRQGLWFQLRHAADGQSVASKLARVILRVLILGGVCCLLVGIYLVKRVGKSGFKEDVSAAIESSLRGSNVELGTIKKDRDVATISSIEMEGEDEAFFHQLEARQVSFNMKLTDGLLGVWHGGSVFMDRLDLTLKAGARNDQSASQAYGALFDDHPSFFFERIEADETNLKWGYSEKNRGSIEKSQMRANRTGDQWELNFSGGRFNQNWLKNLEIDYLTVICDRQGGVHLKKGRLLSGKGSLTFGVKVGAGGQPQLDGQLSFESFPLATILPYRYSEWLSGSVSGEGRLSGSTNSQQGVEMDIRLSLKDGDQLVMRDSLPLLSALRVVDLYNSYRKVIFTEGSFHIVTGQGRVEIDEIDLKAGDLMFMGGDVKMRPATHQDIADALKIKDVEIVANIIDEAWQNNQGLDSLKEDAVQPDNDTAMSRRGKDVLRTAILSEKESGRYEGTIRIGLKGDAFDKSPRLKQTYPKDTPSGRIWIDVPMNGKYETLTLSQAKQLYVLGRNRTEDRQDP